MYGTKNLEKWGRVTLDNVFSWDLSEFEVSRKLKWRFLKIQQATKALKELNLVRRIK